MEQLKHFFGMRSTRNVQLLVGILTTVFVIGFVSIFVRMPAAWLDEFIHYERSVVIANPGASTQGGYLSKTQKEFIDTALKERMKADVQTVTPEVISLDWSKYVSHIPYSEELVFSSISEGASVYTPVVYAPYTAGVFVGKLFKLPPLVEYYVMKLFGFLTCFLLLVLAVKIVPAAKITYALIGALPTLVIGASSFSADSVTNALIILFVALTSRIIVQCYKGEKVSKRLFFIYLAFSLLLVFAKNPAFLVLALHLPVAYIGYKTKAMCKKQVAILLAWLVICAVVTVGLYALVSNVNGNITTYGRTDIDAKAQLQFILENPKRFLSIFIKNTTWFNVFNLQLGYSDRAFFSNIPTMVFNMTYAGILLSLFIRDEEEILEKDHTYTGRAFLEGWKWMTWVGVICIVFLVFYLQVTGVGSDGIQGIQSRYFTPYLVLLVPTIYTSPSYFKKGSWLITGVALSSTLLYAGFLIIQLFT